MVSGSCGMVRIVTGRQKVVAAEATLVAALGPLLLSLGRYYYDTHDGQRLGDTELVLCGCLLPAIKYCNYAAIIAIGVLL